ncbi:ribose transport system substrate-binding protein [Paenibacillus cellulosilyticus]|uniref:Ribose transport system substrate-binding protein n=1 Tax=Paenibacillus cellulosilyticus TaxID=375489 RepID=A0A2V2YQ08_9BACL|nr:substrate-binding domain-containing protein [Paenibacillus cellulosilyticus]PWV98622.1 ribose transport system substrate-binding protein [Paenibacillus cellulosilyticus]QKS43860.1 substrate-binding domain-containing protein [Paenibacillus cellulosilyticus]
MSTRQTTLLSLLLLALFAALLVLFFTSVFQVQRLAQSLVISPSAEQVQQPRVVLIAQETDNPFWLEIKQGAQAAAETFELSLSYIGPSRINPEEQLRLLAKMITSKPYAIIVQGLNDPNYRALIDEAHDLGITVVTMDADEQGSKRLAYVGSDNRKAGRQLGEQVAAATGGSGQIGVLMGSSAVNQKLRLQGFKDAIAQYPQLRIVDARTTSNSRLRAVEQTTELIQQHPAINAIVGFSALDGPGMAEAVRRLEAASTAGGDNEALRTAANEAAPIKTASSAAAIKYPALYAFDLLPGTREAITQCLVSATIVQKPYEMGYEAVKLLRELTSAGQELANILTETTVMTRQKLGLQGGCP